MPVITEGFHPISNNTYVSENGDASNLGEVWGDLLFFVLKVPTEPARHEIVSLLKPRQVSSQEVSGVPKKCVGGCVGGNLVQVKKFVPNGLH